MFRMRTCVSSAMAGSVARRFVKSTDSTHEDARWLEAQFADDAEKTVEERYASEKQRDVLQKLMSKLRDENSKSTDAKIANLQKENEERRLKETSELKASIAELSKKLASLQK